MGMGERVDKHRLRSTVAAKMQVAVRARNLNLVTFDLRGLGARQDVEIEILLVKDSV